MHKSRPGWSGGGGVSVCLLSACSRCIKFGQVGGMEGGSGGRRVFHCTLNDTLTFLSFFSYFLGSDPSFPASESQHLYRQALDQEEKSSTGGWSSRSTGGWSSRNGSSSSECLTCSAGCQFSEVIY